ncbi:hypothetical protein LguiA_014201 [Lonicera macranthoides]
MDRQNHANYKVKLMCSYGGKIQCRPHDHALIYAGGDTKILTVDRTIKFRDMIAKICTLCNCNAQFSLKYQLPGEDLDALVSVMDDDDAEHMMVEYDRIHRIISSKPPRLRLFVFPLNRPLFPGPTLTPDFLFGFDEYPDPRDGAGHLLSRDRHVIGGNDCFPAPGGVRPVYNYLPVMAVGQERRIPVGEHVAPYQNVKVVDATLSNEFKGLQLYA